jgi:hypothetical protein
VAAAAAAGATTGRADPEGCEDAMPAAAGPRARGRGGPRGGPPAGRALVRRAAINRARVTQDALDCGRSSRCSIDRRQRGRKRARRRQRARSGEGRRQHAMIVPCTTEWPHEWWPGRTWAAAATLLVRTLLVPPCERWPMSVQPAAAETDRHRGTRARYIAITQQIPLLLSVKRRSTAAARLTCRPSALIAASPQTCSAAAAVLATVGAAAQGRVAAPHSLAAVRRR